MTWPFVWTCLPCQVGWHEACQGQQLVCECFLIGRRPNRTLVLCPSVED